jgi:hypothetical protein
LLRLKMQITFCFCLHFYSRLQQDDTRKICHHIILAVRTSDSWKYVFKPKILLLNHEMYLTVLCHFNKENTILKINCWQQWPWFCQAYVYLQIERQEISKLFLA